MSTSTPGRMLLSHNYDVSPEVVPAFSREAFADVFRQGLSEQSALAVQLLAHPHWMVEIRCDHQRMSPEQVGELCAQAMLEARQTETAGQRVDLLVLGGLKTTPPSSSAPGTLQPGEWGVDVVETASGADFLRAIAWDSTVSQKPAEQIFKVERLRPAV